MLARTVAELAPLFCKIEGFNSGLVPSIDEPKRKCSPPIPARLYRRATVISQHQRHICGKLCLCLGVHLAGRSVCNAFSWQRGALPATIWLFHFLEMGEALPELVGEADWRPASRAMMGERLRVRRDAGHYLHLSNGVRIFFIGNQQMGVWSMDVTKRSELRELLKAEAFALCVASCCRLRSPIR